MPFQFFLFSVFTRLIFGDECIITTFSQVTETVQNCQNIVINNLTVPAGETLKLNLTDGTRVTFKGQTTFEYFPWKGPLVTINGTSVIVEGEPGHIFDGKGQLYWDGLGDWGVPKPQFFTVQTFGGSVIKNIYVLNSPHDVLQVTNSNNATYSGWFINNTAGDENVAPEGKFAKNTDAFDVWNSTNIVIKDALVHNQDDCVALRCGSNITIYNLECHGTHGLSISVGFSNSSLLNNPLNMLSNVLFENNTLYDSENVIHIKTHNEGGYGEIRNVSYKNIFASGTKKYGILIEENYPNHGEPLNNVPIRNLNITDVFGDLTKTAQGVSIVCAQDGCENWHWSNIEFNGSKKPNSCNFIPQGTDICNK